MSALRKLVRGAMVVVAAAGFTLLPAAPAEAAAPAAVEAVCPFAEGWYLLYDENDELVGIMYIDKDCRGTAWF